MALPFVPAPEMDPRLNAITISTHNVNGFNHSQKFLHSLCDQVPDAIRAIQEHWLAPPYKKQKGVNRLRTLHPAFDGFGNSGMQKDVENKVRLGRGKGGTGFLYNKQGQQTKVACAQLILLISQRNQWRSPNNVNRLAQRIY